MHGLKSALKRIPWLYGLNARVRCAQVKRRYARTVERYARSDKRDSDELLSSRVRASRLAAKVGRAPLDILLLGTDEQQDRSGMLQALEGSGRLTCFTRADGSYGQNEPAPPAERRANNTRRLREIVERLAARGCPPDILVGQTWAGVVAPDALGEIRSRYGTFVVNIAMDDRHQYWGRRVRGEWDGTYPLIPHLDLTLTAAPECVEWYEREGCPALFFPEASDPAIFRPMPELPKVHDVCFVGGRYGIREKLVAALRAGGIRVAAYGSDWEDGRIATEAVPQLFAQSKIVLGIGTIGHCEDFFALKLRDFDGPMSGSLYLTHDNPDLALMYEIGKEIVTFRSVPECVKKARYLLANDGEREEIAAAGRRRAARDHTWDRRFETLFRTLGQAVG